MLSHSMMSRETAADEQKCLGPHDASTYYHWVQVLALFCLSYVFVEIKADELCLLQ